jgi:hypothetical protein
MIIQNLNPIGGGTSEILKEILSKMIIDKQNYQASGEIILKFTIFLIKNNIYFCTLNERRCLYYVNYTN